MCLFASYMFDYILCRLYALLGLKLRTQDTCSGSRVGRSDANLDWHVHR